jgi:hypothetical protein
LTRFSSSLRFRSYLSYRGQRTRLRYTMRKIISTQEYHRLLGSSACRFGSIWQLAWRVFDLSDENLMQMILYSLAAVCHRAPCVSRWPPDPAACQSEHDVKLGRSRCHGKGGGGGGKGQSGTGPHAARLSQGQRRRDRGAVVARRAVRATLLRWRRGIAVVARTVFLAIMGSSKICHGVHGAGGVHRAKD